MITKVLTLFLLVTYTLTSPLPRNKDADNHHRVLYDQRQEGEWNVRADLQNFIIMVIPTSTNSSPAAGLLDFLRAAPPRGHLKRLKNVNNRQHQPEDQGKEKNEAAAQETMHFIESKSAPYQVDITKSRSHLAKLHAGNDDEIVIANSPSLSLVKTATDVLRNVRNARAYVFSYPSDEEFVVSAKKSAKKVVKKKTIKESPKDAKDGLKLLGADNEQCGPGMVRDSYGMCRNSPK